MVSIEVAYATPDVQRIIALDVLEGTTIAAAIEQSGILAVFPEINLDQQVVGIFSVPCQLSDTVASGDRVEIYRSLLIDPKVARRKRAASDK